VYVLIQNNEFETFQNKKSQWNLIQWVFICHENENENKNENVADR